MIGKELKRLSRRELVDIIYQMKKNEQQLQEEIASLQEQLEDKRIRHSMAGSIAEAATSVTNLFATAQAAADLYLNEITCMRAETEKECAEMIEQTRKSAESILQATEVADQEQSEKWLQFLEEIDEGEENEQ